MVLTKEKEDRVYPTSNAGKVKSNQLGGRRNVEGAWRPDPEMQRVEDRRNPDLCQCQLLFGANFEKQNCEV